MNDSIARMEGPAVYRICVEGQLAADWYDRLEDMNITRLDSLDGQRKTVLVGRLPDQAALAGLLSTLYELHLPLLSVECLEVG